MTRGGAARERTEPERRCIATGVSGPTARLVRFVLGPGGEVVPDLAARLPGRGVWLTAERALVDRAVAKRLFARAFRAPATAPADLADRLEALLARRVVELIGLARKAGQAVTGFEKVRARLKEGGVAALIEASDGAPDGRDKLARIAPDVPVIDALDAQELGLAFGRDFAIHAALDRGGFADRVIGEAARLGGLRSAGTKTDETRHGAAGTDDTAEAGPKAAPGQGD
jgi:predicted RNA-binding protein YlxR (DUF448 family)